MTRCAQCGNDYERPFDVTIAGKTHSFDSFECAIHMLAPECGRCGFKVVEHGTEKGGVTYCCDHCAQHAAA